MVTSPMQIDFALCIPYSMPDTSGQEICQPGGLADTVDAGGPQPISKDRPNSFIGGGSQ